MGAGTGLRRSELLGLTLDRVAFDFARIRVDRQLSRTSRSDAVSFGPPKTESSTRVIPVARVVLDAIRDQDAIYGHHRSGLLFTTEGGSPLTPSTLHAAWQAAAQMIGVRATPHDLRHYFASVHIRSGQSIKVLQALLGHKSAGETWDTYGHLMGDEDDRSRSVIEGVLGNSGHSTATVRPADCKTAGQKLGADGLAHRPGSVRRTASRRNGWRPSISGCRCRHPPATYPRARTDRPRTLAVWSCSKWGLPSHGGLPSRWWSLAPPFHPYRRSEERRRSVFCGTDPAGCPGWALPTTLSCGARTFLDTPGLPIDDAVARPAHPRRHDRWRATTPATAKLLSSHVVHVYVDFFTSLDLWVAFLTLFALELVLGIDNVVFISILTNRLPEAQRPRARIIGLSLALVMRILLLIAASCIIGLTATWFSIGTAEALRLSGRDLILIVGGLFLIYKAVTEIHAKLEGEDDHEATNTPQTTFAKVIVQIILIDAVFSLDSVITAVGMVDELYIMIAAVMLSIGLMMVLATRISDFVNAHPTVKMLALTFLVLIGSTLVADGFDVHVDKPLIHGPIAFAIAVEALNLSYRRRQQKRAGHDSRLPCTGGTPRPRLRAVVPFRNQRRVKPGPAAQDDGGAVPSEAGPRRREPAASRGGLRQPRRTCS